MNANLYARRSRIPCRRSSGWLTNPILRQTESSQTGEGTLVILAHNYMTPEIFHCVADFAGDSLQLAREAAKTDAKIIVQAGVHFMAETSKLLSPDKTVLIPDLFAGCSLPLLSRARTCGCYGIAIGIFRSSPM